MATFTHWFRRLFRASVLIVGVVLLVPGITHADTFGVHAHIPYDPPTQAAEFDSGFDGTTVEAAQLALTGTCELMNPQTIVVIERNGSSIGSAPCDGNFSVQVTLVEGDNTMVARSVNVSGLYGPDSAPITVTLHLPPPPPTPPTPEEPVTPGPESASPAQQVTATNFGASENLTIAPTEPFSVLNDANEITISVVVGGGEKPYDIILNWGDGSIETHHVDTPGTYTFTHQYQKPGAFKIHGRIRDVLGAYTEFEHAVLSAIKLPSGDKPPASGGTITGKGVNWSLVGAAAIIGILALVMWLAYWLGVHRTAKKLLSSRSRISKTYSTAKRRGTAKSKKPKGRTRR